MVTTGVPMSPASIWPPNDRVSVVGASTALLNSTLKTALLPSLTVPASDTVSTGTSSPGPESLVSMMVPVPVSVMPAGKAAPLAVLPLKVPVSTRLSLPSKTTSLVVGTVTTMPPVVPAGTVKL
ncbi:hypothetical protein D3C85_1522870 [compost metagenome]